jgi:tetratricopeptide (TPR) repeat protein
MLDTEKTYEFSFVKQGSKEKAVYSLSGPQKGALIVSGIIAVYLIVVLARFWQADRYYYFGSNIDRTGDYQRAYGLLQTAVDLRPSEPVFRDEFALNNAVVGTSLLYQNSQQPNEQNVTLGKQLIESAIANSNRLQMEHPNNIVFAKSRIRIYYTLSQIDPTYLSATLDAIKKAQILAPTDPDISYNLGVLYGQTGDFEKGVSELKKTIKLKPDYFNAYYALAIFYHEASLDKNKKVVKPELAQMAIDQIKASIKKFGPNQQLQTALDAWTNGTN